MAEQKPPHAAPPVSADAVAAARPAPTAERLEPRHLYKAAGLAFLLALAFKFFDQIAQVFLLSFAAGILALGIDALLGWLPLKRRWVAVLAGLVTVGAVVALVAFGAPVLVEQTKSTVEMGPGLDEKVKEWERSIQQATGLAIDLPSPGGGKLQLPAGGSGAFGKAIGLLEVLFIPIIIFFGGLFALASPNERLLNPLLRIVRPDLRPAFYRIFQLLGERLVGWLKGTLTAMVGVGALSVAVFWAIGIPNAVLLGLVNGTLEFIPLVGPWLGGGIAVAVAFLDDPSKALWAALAVLAIQQVEANLITPFAMRKNAEIHPFVTLFALVLFGGLFGFLGLLLALPLVLLVWTIVQVLWVERALDTDRDRIAPVVQE